MRRGLIFLLLALCLLSSASAMTLPYPAETVISVQGLTAEQSALAAYLYAPIFNMEETISLPPGTRYDDAEAAMTSLTRDYPELFHLGRSYTLSYYAISPEYATAVTPQYRMTAEEAADTRIKLYVAAYMAVSEYPDALALHDHVCDIVTYGGDTEMAHTAVGALLEGRATCEGYAQAITLLYRMADIPCGVVTGEATDSHGDTARHAWNIADIDGYCLIDATWNDQELLGLNTHWYYGLSTGYMAADHTPDPELRVPICSGEANWHDRNGYIVSWAEQADKAIRRLVAGETVNLRAGDRTMYTALTDDLPTWLEHYNQRNPDAPFYGAYSMTVSDTQLCVILRRAE